MNIALFDKEFKIHEIKDVVINDDKELTQVNVLYKGPVQAIMLNLGDHGYATTHFDQKSMDFFEEHLNKVQDNASRFAIWEQLWYNMRDEKMSSIQLMNYMAK